MTEEKNNNNSSSNKEMTDNISNNTNTINTNYMAEIGPFKITPTYLFMFAAIPFGFGAYSGYVKHTKEVAILDAKAKAAKSSSSSGQTTTTKIISSSSKILQNQAIHNTTIDGRIIAVRALSIATMMSVGGFAAIGAVTFYVCGYQSFDDAFRSLRSWGNTVKSSANNSMSSVTKRINDTHDFPDKVATSNMTEEEEWAYISSKYLRDDQILVEESSSSSSNEQRK